MDTTTLKTRYRTGEASPCNGHYCWDGWAEDGIGTTEPDTFERNISLAENETFPAMSGELCWWRFIQQV